MLASLLLLFQTVPTESADFFPGALGKPIPHCRFGAKVVSQPILSDSARAWYGAALRAAEEPSLYTRSQRPRALGTTVRFTWLRTFDAPIVVRVEGIGAPAPRLIAKRLSGKGGYGPGEIEAEIDRALSHAEVASIKAVLAHSAPFAPPAKPASLRECFPPGTDGAEWVVEGLNGTGYHFAKDFTPSSGAVRAIGLALLALTGWRVEPIY